MNIDIYSYSDCGPNTNSLQQDGIGISNIFVLSKLAKYKYQYIRKGACKFYISTLGGGTGGYYAYLNESPFKYYISILGGLGGLRPCLFCLFRGGQEFGKTCLLGYCYHLRGVRGGIKGFGPLANRLQN